MAHITTSHTINLDQDDGTVLVVHYELTTWSEGRYVGAEHFRDVKIIWTTAGGKEVPIPPDAERRVLAAI